MTNVLQWDGSPGHYEVYYLTLTDPTTGVGAWIRYTMLAPLEGAATAALWLAIMDPRPGRSASFARKETFPIDALRAVAEPFSLQIGSTQLSDGGMRGAIGDARWDLRWAGDGPAYAHVHPLARPAASTVLVLPHGDLRIEGTIVTPELDLDLRGVPGGQAHLWGSRHAERWAWVHGNDFTGPDGAAAPGTVLDAVSVHVSRAGRTFGPATPVVGRLEGEDFRSTHPLRVLANPSTFSVTGWRFEAVGGRRKVLVEVDADRDRLVGVTYHDPDGRAAYCYNSEVATMRVQILHRARRVGGWVHRGTLLAAGRAHFEYGDRTPVPGLELLIR